MGDRDVRDLIVEAWEGKLGQLGVRHAHTVALELAVIAEAHGIRLTRPAHLHDPAADYRTPAEGTSPTGTYLAAKAALAKPDGEDR